MLAPFSRCVFAASVLLLTKTVFADSVDIQPSTVTVVYGRVSLGNVGSLSAVDGNCLTVSKFVVPAIPVDPVTFRIETSLPAIPASLVFHLLGHQSNLGQYQQTLNLFDWTKGVFEPQTNVTAMLSKDDTELTCQPIGSVTNYVRQVDNRVWALVRVRTLGLVPTPTWKISYDRAWFETNSGP